MNILQTAPDYPPLVSGVPEVVRQISEGLATRGHEVHVATGAVSGSPQTEVRNGVTIHRFDVHGSFVKGIYGDKGSYVEFVKSRQWDLVASHCSQTWSTDLLFEIEPTTPSIFVAHGLTYTDPIYRDYYRSLAEWLRKKKTMVSLSAIGIDDEDFRRDYGLADAVIIRNGVDKHEWETPALGVRKAWGRDREPWLLNVSVHSPVKSHELLFDVMSRVRSKHVNMHLTQIGRAHSARKWNAGKLGIRGGCYYACKLRSLFEPSISLMEDIPRELTVSAIKEADIMVHPSNWEASPLVILECMAAGTPFVAFDVGCIREHAGGIVVRSTAEMVDAVIELMNDGRHRKDLGEQGKRCIAERHDWEKVVDAYESLFYRVVANGKS
jgi:glycosyltransferase involved in cell wall biosynthesis